jgi:hypothetical protein
MVISDATGHDIDMAGGCCWLAKDGTAYPVSGYGGHGSGAVLVASLLGLLVESGNEARALLDAGFVHVGGWLAGKKPPTRAQKEALVALLHHRWPAEAIKKYGWVVVDDDDIDHTWSL